MNKTPWIGIIIFGLLLGLAPALSAEPVHRDREFPLLEKSGNAHYTPVHRRGGGRGGWRGGYWGGRGFRSGFSFSFGGPIYYGPRWYGPRYYYPPVYYPPPAPYVVVPPAPPLPTVTQDHCSSILNYAERRNLPPGWSIDAFNSEVERCKALKYPALQPGSLSLTPAPPVTSVPQASSWYDSDAACRNLAYQASRGGPGVGSTVEGGILGGALGAAAGAAIGAVAGDPGIGAAIGAVAGGFTGAASNTAAADVDFQSAYANCMSARGH